MLVLKPILIALNVQHSQVLQTLVGDPLGNFKNDKGPDMMPINS